MKIQVIWNIIVGDLKPKEKNSHEMHDRSPHEQVLRALTDLKKLVEPRFASHKSFHLLPMVGEVVFTGAYYRG